ncbi:MAG: glycine/betaine/sarcosine/D-proline family reductase selenoprotein B [Candidatus Marinimicrobia bacterium]|nr:glycine/betaine/sarcosine/D-proline family reductase selenoprotein B [Candidatus Neomarinimicrobiota bacterium]
MKKTDFSFYKKGKQLYYEQLARAYRSKGLVKPEHWTPFKEDLEETRIAFISVAGAYTDDQEPFTEEGKKEDHQYREVDAEYDKEKINFLGLDWDTTEAQKDPKVVFPVKNLVLLQKEGVIGYVHKTAYSFSGHDEDEKELDKSIKKMIEDLEENEIDAAIVIPASVQTGEVAWKISNQVEGASISTAMISMFYEQLLQKPAPRCAYVNFPFGRPFGPANSITLNTAILRDILRLFEKSKRPAQVMSLNYVWSWGKVPAK